MTKIGLRVLALVFSMGVSSVAFALATGSATITGCAPAPVGMKGNCKVSKASGDVQTTHSKKCKITKDGLTMADYDGGSDTHAAGNSSHLFPPTDLSTPFEECVEFKVINYSAWWNIVNGNAVDWVSAYADDTRNTRCG